MGLFLHEKNLTIEYHQIQIDLIIKNTSQNSQMANIMCQSMGVNRASWHVDITQNLWQLEHLNILGYLFYNMY